MLVTQLLLRPFNGQDQDWTCLADCLSDDEITQYTRVLGEFGATIIFAGSFPGCTQTMPLAIYLCFEFNLRLALGLAGAWRAGGWGCQLLF